MKTKKVQSEIFNALTKKDGRVMELICSGQKMYTANGYAAYALNDADNPFEKSRIKCIEHNAMMEDFNVDKDVELTEMRAATFDRLGRIARLYKAPKFSVYVNPDYLKHFDGAIKLYGRSPVDRVIIFENGQIAGLVCPVKVNDGEAVEFVAAETEA